MTRQGKHHTVRSDLTGLTLLIITTKQSTTFYGKMYGKVQYRTPIPSHVPVKVNTVTCAGKGFVTPNKHDELPHSFYSTKDNNNYQQWENTVRRKCEYGVFQITSRRRVIWKIPYSHFRSHSIHIVENYKNSWNCSKMTVFFMFTLCKMARKTHVHTLQWCFLKNSSNRRKVWTWVFLATLQSVNMTNCSTVSVLE